MPFEPLVFLAFLGVCFLFTKRDASFFIEGLSWIVHGFTEFEKMSEGSDSALLLVASFFSLTASVEYEASLGSNFD
jgi:hypothetical protein